MTRKTLILIMGLAFAGILALLFATKSGIGVDPDSTVYFDAARNFAGARGLVVISNSDKGLVPLTHYPPLYSSLLGLATASGGSVETGARWLNALLFGTNIFLVGISIALYARNSFWLPLIGSFLTLTAPDNLAMHSVALTEPLYLALMMGGLLSLGVYLENQRRRFLLAASIAIALAVLTRYVGVAGVVTGIVALFLLRRTENSGVPFTFSLRGKDGRRRLVDAVIFGVISCVPVGLWAIRNRFATGGAAADRQFAFHPPKLQQLVPAFSTVAQWLLLGKVRGDVRSLAFIIEIVAIAGLAIYLMTRRGTSRGTSSTHAPKLPHLLFIFVVAHFLFLVFTTSFLETDTVFDSRSLLPIHLAGLVIALCLAGALYPGKQKSRSTGIVFAVLALLIAGSYGFRATGWLVRVQADGQGYASSTWKGSPTVAQIKNLPPDVPIYSNGVDAIYYLAGRRSIYIPAKIIHGTGAPDSNYAREIERVRNDLREHQGVVIYFKTFPERSFFPTESELTEPLHLRLLATESDGSIYGSYDR